MKKSINIDDMLDEIQEIEEYENAEKSAMNLFLDTESIKQKGELLHGGHLKSSFKKTLRENWETLNELEKDNIFFLNSKVRSDFIEKGTVSFNSYFNIFYYSPSYISGNITKENQINIENIRNVKCFYYPNKEKIKNEYYRTYSLLSSLNSIFSVDYLTILLEIPKISSNSTSQTIKRDIERYEDSLSLFSSFYQKGDFGILEYLESILLERYLLETKHKGVMSLTSLCHSFKMYSLDLKETERKKIDFFIQVISEYYYYNCTIPLMSVYLKDAYYVLRTKYGDKVKDNDIGVYFSYTNNIIKGKKLISYWCSKVYLNKKWYRDNYSCMLHPFLPFYSYSMYIENYNFLKLYSKENSNCLSLFKTLIPPPTAYLTWLEHNEITMTLKDIIDFQKKGKNLFIIENNSSFSNLLKFSTVFYNLELLADVFYYSLIKNSGYKTCKAVFYDGNKKYSVTFKPYCFEHLQQMQNLDDYYRIVIQSSDFSIVVNRKKLLEMYLQGILQFN